MKPCLQGGPGGALHRGINLLLIFNDLFLDLDKRERLGGHERVGGGSGIRSDGRGGGYMSRIGSIYSGSSGSRREVPR